MRETFFRMFADGYIYRGKRLVNWDTHLQTSVADDETYTEDTKSGFWTFKYEVVKEEYVLKDIFKRAITEVTADGMVIHADVLRTPEDDAAEAAMVWPQYISFSTTRPETMLGDSGSMRPPKRRAIQSPHQLPRAAAPHRTAHSHHR